MPHDQTLLMLISHRLFMWHFIKAAGDELTMNSGPVLSADVRYSDPGRHAYQGPVAHVIMTAFLCQPHLPPNDP